MNVSNFPAIPEWVISLALLVYLAILIGVHRHIGLVGCIALSIPVLSMAIIHAVVSYRHDVSHEFHDYIIDLTIIGFLMWHIVILWNTRGRHS